MPKHRPVSHSKGRAKALWEVSLSVGGEAEEAAAELLTEIFRLPASSYQNVETKLARAAIFFPKKPDLKSTTRSKILARLGRLQECGLDVGRPQIRLRKLRAVDWAEAWKRHFKPIEIGSKLLVKPGWSRRLPKKDQAVIILDPGLSFGTGQHPTTAFCLAQTVRFRPRRNEAAKSFLDIGCGSGILAISAARLGYSPIDAFDFDRVAVRVARENAKRNQVSGKVRITRGSVENLPSQATRKYSVVCANLISNLLIAQRRRIVQQVAKDGVLVVAGILAAEFDQVREAFEALGMSLGASLKQKEWRSGCFLRRRN
jgi:ribosomal protein L11 methyltransferase